MNIKKALYLALPLILCSCGGSGKTNLVKTITSYDADGTKTRIKSFTYDNQGRETSIVEEYIDEEDISSFKTDVTYAGDYEIYDVDSEYNEKTKEWEKIVLSSYSYNENKQLVSKTVTGLNNSNPTTNAIFVYEYDNKNNVVSEKYYTLDDEAPALYAEVKYEYNSKNLVSKECKYLLVGETLELTQYVVNTYDEQNRIIKSEEYFEEDELTGYYTYSYSASSETSSYFEVFDDNTTLEKIKEEYILDKDGKISRYNYYNLEDDSNNLKLDYYDLYEY